MSRIRSYRWVSVVLLAVAIVAAVGRSSDRPRDRAIRRRAGGPLEDRSIGESGRLDRLVGAWQEDKTASFLLPDGAQPRPHAGTPDEVYSGPEWDALSEETRRAFMADDPPGAGGGNAGGGDAAGDDGHVCPPEETYIGASTEGGRIPHSFEVDEEGRAVLQIPIRVPPGPRRMQPRLSFVYRTGTGPSPVGFDWSIGGLSSIGRVRTSWALHGFLAAPQMNDADALALDGNRLVWVGDSWRTLEETFSKIEPNGDWQRNGFRVRTADGLILHYGTTPDSLVGRTPEGVAHAFLVNRIEDRTGNCIDYQYWPDEGLLRFVTYARGTRRVEFVSEEGRSDAITGYRDGVEFRSARRLRAVRVFGPRGLVREYRLANEHPDVQSGRLLLDSIREVAADGVSLPPLEFRYGFQNPGGLHGRPGYRPLLLGQATYNRLLANGSSFPHGPVAADVDGDGKDELIWWQSGRLQCQFWDADLRVEIPTTATAPSGATYEEFARDVSRRRPRPIDYNADGRADLLVLRDKKFRILLSRGTVRNGALEVDEIDTGVTLPALSTGEANPYFCSDIDGDGDKDLLYLKEHAGGFWTFRLSEPDGFGPERAVTNARVWLGNLHFHSFVFVDVDGDGAEDLFQSDQKPHWLHEGWYRFADSLQNAANIRERGLPRLPGNHPFFLDVNGDGLRDYACWQDWGTPTIQVALNRGGGAFEEWSQVYSASPLLPAIPSGAPPAIADFNGDGREDLLLMTYTGTGGPVNAGSGGVYHDSAHISIVLIASREGYLERGITIPSYGVTAEDEDGHSAFVSAFTSRLILDANGDGRNDVVCVVAREDNGQPVYGLARESSGKTGLLETITDGMGLRTRISYLPLSDPAAYSRTGAISHPLVPTTPRRMVVSRVDQGSRDDGRADGLAIANSWEYGYGDEAFHPADRRSTGFRTRTIRHLPSMETTHVRTDGARRLVEMEIYPFGRFVKDSVREVPLGGGRFHRSALHQTMEYRLVPHPNGARTYFPFVRESRRFLHEANREFEARTENWELIDAESRYVLRVTRFAYPAELYGKPERVETVTQVLDFGPGGGPQDYRTVTGTAITYRNDLANWLLALPEYRTDFAQGAGQAATQRTTRSTFDAQGRLRTRVFEPGGGDLQVTLTLDQPDAFGNLQRTRWDVATGVDRTVRTEFDIEGVHPERFIDAAGLATRFCHHSGLGLLVRREEPGGIVSEYHYDGFGRIRGEIRFDGTSTRYSYSSPTPGFPRDPFIVWTYEFPRGVKSGEEYLASEVRHDYRGLPRYERWRTRDGGWSDQQREYDAQGRLVALSVPGAAPGWMRATRDALGRVREIEHPDLVVSRIDHDRLTVVTTRRGQPPTTEVLDPAGLPIVRLDANGERTTYRYDGWGDLNRLTLPSGHSMTWTRDRRGRCLQQSDPDLGTIFTRFDGHGLPIRQAQANRVTNMTYDSMGRLVRMDYDMAGNEARGGSARWVYDNQIFPHRLTRKTFGETSTDYGYDLFGRITRTTTAIAGQAFRMDVSYNSHGQFDTLTYPADPWGGRLAVRHAYDKLGRLKRLSHPQWGSYWELVETDDSDRITYERFPGGIGTRREFDRMGLLRSIRTGQGDGSIQDIEFTYWEGSLNLREKIEPGRVESFDYDALDRLTHWRRDGALRQEYRYDRLGNMTFKSDVGAMVHADANRPHRLTSVAGQAVRYDAWGNVLNSPGRYEVEWAASGQPRRIRRNGQATDFDYDADGVRVRKAGPDGTTYYVGGFYELFVGSDGRQEARCYIQGPERVVAIETRTGPGAGRRQFLHRDHRGSTVASTDINRNVVRFGYEPFGSATARPGFAGQDADVELGLIAFRGRVMDPRLGRFLSADPMTSKIPHASETHPYSYVRNNPLRNSDPSGYFGIDLVNELIDAETSPEVKGMLGIAGQVNASIDPEDDGGGGLGGALIFGAALAAGFGLNELIDNWSGDGSSGSPRDDAGSGGSRVNHDAADPGKFVPGGGGLTAAAIDAAIGLSGARGVYYYWTGLNETLLSRILSLQASNANVLYMEAATYEKAVRVSMQRAWSGGLQGAQPRILWGTPQSPFGGRVFRAELLRHGVGGLIRGGLVYLAFEGGWAIGRATVESLDNPELHTARRYIPNEMEDYGRSFWRFWEWD